MSEKNCEHDCDPKYCSVCLVREIRDERVRRMVESDYD